MIFKQFMVRDCCEMFSRRYRYALVLVLFILPLISSSDVTRRRRRPNVESSPNKREESSYQDQIAEPSKYESNNLKSSPYSSNNEPGYTRHGKIVVNTAEPSQQQQLDSLADSKTAEEYVHNALKLQTGYNAPIPERINQVEPAQLNAIEDLKPKFSEYEVYEAKQRQHGPQYFNFNQDTGSYSAIDSYEYNEQTSPASVTQSLYEGYPNLNTVQSAQTTVSNSDFQPNVNYEQATNTAYTAKEVKPLIKSSEQYETQPLQSTQQEQNQQKKVQYYVQAPTPLPQATNQYGQQEYSEQLAPKSYDYFEPEERPVSKSTIFFQYKNQPQTKAQKRPQYYLPDNPSNQYSNDDEAFAHDLPKQQILRQIEHSVNKYIKTLENANKGSRVPQENRNGNNYKERPNLSDRPYSLHQSASQNVDSVHDIIENLNDNIQFIYKARTRPPVQHRIPLNFDNDGAIKTFPLDAPYQLTGEISAKMPHHTSPFLKNNYREINRFPFLDNKPRSSKLNRENQIINKDIFEGRPIQSSYQPILRKHPSESSWKPIYPGSIPTDNREINDSYSPKFNNNPEGFGYQHHYKPPVSELKGSSSAKRHVKPPKRGKRGGGVKGTIRGIEIDLAKDPEANVALRPPPY